MAKEGLVQGAEPAENVQGDTGQLGQADRKDKTLIDKARERLKGSKA
jgi:hypothetical protein